jgi:hypothetical protein
MDTRCYGARHHTGNRAEDPPRQTRTNFSLFPRILADGFAVSVAFFGAAYPVAVTISAVTAAVTADWYECPRRFFFRIPCICPFRQWLVERDELGVPLFRRCVFSTRVV